MIQLHKEHKSNTYYHGCMLLILHDICIECRDGQTASSFIQTRQNLPNKRNSTLVEYENLDIRNDHIWNGTPLSSAGVDERSLKSAL